MNKETYRKLITDLIIWENDGNMVDPITALNLTGDKKRISTDIQGKGVMEPMISEVDIQTIASRMNLGGPYYVIGFERMIYYAVRKVRSIPELQSYVSRLTSEDIKHIANKLISRIKKRLEIYSHGKSISIRKYGETTYGLRYDKKE